MEISTRYIKISSRIEIKEDYEMGKEVVVPSFRAEVVKIEFKNNQNGTQLVVYSLKPL